MNKIGLGWLIFGIWIISTSWLLYQTGQQHYGEFDPQRQLQQQMKQLPQLNAIAQPQNGNAVVLHVLDESCPCYQKALAHIQTIQASLAQQPLQQRYLTSAQLRAVGVTVPATPMVIYLQDQHIRYSGPYASGPACSALDDLLGAVLQNTVQTPGSWLNSETQACRCLIQQQG